MQCYFESQSTSREGFINDMREIAQTKITFKYKLNLFRKYFNYFISKYVFIILKVKRFGTVGIMDKATIRALALKSIIQFARYAPDTNVQHDVNNGTRQSDVLLLQREIAALLHLLELGFFTLWCLMHY